MCLDRQRSHTDAQHPANSSESHFDGLSNQVSTEFIAGSTKALDYELLGDGPDAPAVVRVRFGERSLDISISGTVQRERGADLRQAVDRARERARVHAGSLDLRLSRGQARVLARLPVPEG